MIALLILGLSMIVAAVAIRLLKRAWLKSGRRTLLRVACAISLVAIGASFFIGKSEIVPKSVFSVLLVFAGVIYFAIQGYSILKIESNKTG